MVRRRRVPVVRRARGCSRDRGSSRAAELGPIPITANVRTRRRPLTEDSWKYTRGRTSEELSHRDRPRRFLQKSLSGGINVLASLARVLWVSDHFAFDLMAFGF